MEPRHFAWDGALTQELPLLTRTCTWGWRGGVNKEIQKVNESATLFYHLQFPFFLETMFSFICISVYLQCR